MVDIKDSKNPTPISPPVQESVAKPLESVISGTAQTNPPQDEASKVKYFKKSSIKKIIILVIVLFSLLVISSVLSQIVNVGRRNIQNKGEIVWWGLQEEDTIIAPLIADFQANNPEVRVTYVRQSEKDYADRLYNSLKKGLGPDIFEIHTSWIPDFRGLLATLPESVMSEDDYKNTFYTSIYNSLKTKDGIIGIPLYYDALTLYINVDIFNSARKDPPKSWNDILFLSDPAKGGLTLKSGSDLVQSAIALGNTSNVDYWQDILAFVLYQNKINPASPDVKQINEVISYLKEFERSGVWSSRLPNSTTTFSRGELAMYFGTMASAPEILRANPNLRFKTVPLPQLPNNAPTDPQYAYATYYFQAVDKSSTNKQASWQLLKFLSEKSSIEKLNQGRKSVRAFEFPSPRKDMYLSQEKDAVVGSILYYADIAKTWYLADNADDSAGGINTNITKLYKDAMEKTRVDAGFTTSVKDTLNKFGVTGR